MPPMCEWPDLLPGYSYLEARHYGPLFTAPPTLVILHRPAFGTGVAEYFHSANDGRKVSTHFAPSIKSGGLVQCVSLRRVCWGAGGGVWRGDNKLNFRSIQVELGCPMSQHWSQHYTDQARALLRCLAAALPSLVEVVGHHDVDPRNRSDPGVIPWGEVLDGTGWGCRHV